MRHLLLLFIFVEVAWAQGACFYGTGTSDKVTLSNLVIRSEELDNAAWTKSRTTISANSVIAPDGALTADTIVATATTNSFLVGQNVTGSPTLGEIRRTSAYFKKGTLNHAVLADDEIGHPDHVLRININTCTVVDATNVNSYLTLMTGNGWCRVTMQYTVSATVAITTYLNLWNGVATGAYPSFAATTADYIYAWGVQHNLASSPADYLTSVASATTLAGVCASGTSQDPMNPSKCIEVVSNEKEFRTTEQIEREGPIECGKDSVASAKGTASNLTLYSQEFDNAAWTLDDCTLTPNNVEAPDGTMTGDTMVANSISTLHAIYPSASMSTITNGAHYRFSLYMKYANHRYAQIYYQGSSNLGVTVDLQEGEITNQALGVTSSKITPQENGWYKVTFTTVATGTTLFPTVNLAPSADAVIGAGFLTSSVESIHLWGYSVQLVSAPEDYVVTTSANTTRGPECGLARVSSAYHPNLCVPVYP